MTNKEKVAALAYRISSHKVQSSKWKAAHKKVIMLGQEKCPLIIAIFAIIVGEGEADDIIIGQTVNSPPQSR